MDGAAGRSVRDVSADDVPVEHEHAGVDRRGGVRVIQDLIDIARGLLARVRREIEALTFLQRVVAREDAVVGRLGNADPPPPPETSATTRITTARIRTPAAISRGFDSFAVMTNMM